MANMEYFDLYQHSPVLIYGAGALGIEIYHKICDVYQVCGFIDKRKIRLNFDEKNDIPVYQINDLPDLYKCVVIICVHNAIWHYEIANDLYDAGFNRILFLAMQETYNQAAAKYMNTMYSYFLEENYEKLKHIPYYSVLKSTSYTANIIRESGNYVVALCGRELIFSREKKEEHQNIHKITDEHLKYGGCPIVVCEVYLSLMRYYICAQGSPDLFISLWKDLINGFEMDDKQFLAEQWQIYQLLEREYDQGIDMLQYMPIDVSWNQRGYFNIEDGHHRAAFYYIKGLRNIPIRMKKSDYICWLHSDKVNAVFKALKIARPRLPILHPCFFHVEYSLHEYEESSVELVIKYIYKTEKEYNSLLDASDFCGEFARAFYRTKKAKKMVAIVTEEELPLQKAINELYYIPLDEVQFKAASIDQLTDSFECGVLCGKYGFNELPQLCGIIDELIIKEIIWQSKENIEEEKKYILDNTQFKHYEKIGIKCVNGKLREIGIFTKVQ